MRFSGIAASPGIAVGPVFRFEREEFMVRDTPVAADRIEAEVEWFHRALDRSREDLKQIRKGIAAELGPEEAAIYEAHLLMVDDPEMARAVVDGIRHEGRNAPWVFRNYMSSVAARLEQVANDYMRERQADVLDVERRVLRHLLGEGSRALPRVETPSVLVAHDLGPSEVALLDRAVRRAARSSRAVAVFPRS